MTDEEEKLMREYLFPQISALEKILQVQLLHSLWDVYWSQMISDLPADFRERRTEDLQELRKDLLDKYGLDEQNL